MSELYKEVKEVCFNEAHSLKQLTKKEKNRVIIAKNYSSFIKNKENDIKNFEIQDEIKESLFDTQVSTKETCIYTNTRFSMSENTHREDISCFEKQNKPCQEKLQQEISKQDSTDTTLRLYDLKVVLQKFLHSNKKQNYKDYMLNPLHREAIKKLMDKEIQETNEIQLEDSYKERMNANTLAQLNEFLQPLSQTGLFILKENKKALIQTIQYYIDSGIDIQQCIEYSKTTNSWCLCHTYNAYNNMIYYKKLRNVWNLCLEKIEQTEKIKLQQLLQTHGKDIQRFINYRREKRRYINTYAYNSLCLHLIDMKSKNIDITEAINQSIQRDYNWVFPPTHRKRQYKCYSNRFYPRTQKYSNKNKNRKIA